MIKLIRKIFGILVILSCAIACKEDFSVDLTDRQFIRLDKQSVSITVGEKYTISAVSDTLGSASENLTWRILDPAVASVVGGENHSAIITGLAEGTTVIEVASTDGRLKYYADLTVGKDRIFKILAIGNSFSEDAIENYLHDLTTAAGQKVVIGNMYINEQSLEGHWQNASENRGAYQLRRIAVDGSRNTTNNQTLEAAIAGENWDYISFQEVSQQSGIIDGYQEYLPQLVDYARALTTNPEVKFILHQTWAYAQDSNHEGFNNYDRDQIKMYDAIVDAVMQAKDIGGVDLVIPTGTAIQNARTSYLGDKFTRDGYHLSLVAGRFTAAATWFEAIFGNVLTNTYAPGNLAPYDANLVKNAAVAAVAVPTEVTELTAFLYPEPNHFELNSPMYIDFGNVESPAPFNNFKHPNDLKLSDLKDANGANTGFAIELSEPFTGVLDRGLQNALGMPTSASQDMFFSDGIQIPQSGFIVSNLNKAKKYTFVFYGAINDNGTETLYTVTGKNEGSGLLDNDDNLDKLVVISDIEPADDATISIRLSAGPNNNQWARFFGVNAMLVLPEGMDASFALDTDELQ